AKDGLTLTNGSNSFTVIAQDSQGRADTNIIAGNFPTTVSVTFDNNGNLTSDGLRGFDYDDENRLTRITVTNNFKTELVYDGLGRRKMRYEFLWFNGAWAQNNQVEYAYDGNVVIQERWGGDEPWVNYTRGLDLSGSWQGAAGIGGLLAWSQKISGAYQSHYYHADGNGNVTAMLNTNQVISARYLYDPYGNLLASSGGMADVNAYRFSSQEFHEKSGLYCYAMRLYEPRLGRWLNGDPLREGGGINLYSFCGGDPINRIDPWGLQVAPPPAAPAAGRVLVNVGKTALRFNPITANLAAAFVAGYVGQQIIEALTPKDPGPDPLPLPERFVTATPGSFSLTVSTPQTESTPPRGTILGEGQYIGQDGRIWDEFGPIPDQLNPLSAENIAHGKGQSESFQLLLKQFQFISDVTAVAGSKPTDTAQAHHVFSKALKDRFMLDYGINVWEGKYGTWWEGEVNQGLWKEYNDDWTRFLNDPTPPSREQVLQHGRDLGVQYGFKTYF
ncbi:MAG: RHS repeat-associated core domain-containing protein, partial [Verrucomicrobia bacterium]|nr:RHS repeat-associated core domain-containing protein [Verrucomicrobiota bacterium]